MFPSKSHGKRLPNLQPDEPVRRYTIQPFTAIKKSPGPKTRKRNGKVAGENFSSFIFRVLKQVHPDLFITRGAMNIINSLVNDLFDRIAMEANRWVQNYFRLLVITKKKTLTAREVATAARLLFPEGLASHAMREARNAVEIYRSRTDSND